MPWWKHSSSPQEPPPSTSLHNQPSLSTDERSLPTTTAISVPSVLLRSNSTTTDDALGRTDSHQRGRRQSLVELTLRLSSTVTSNSSDLPPSQSQTAFALQCPTPSRLSVSPSDGNYFDRSLSIPDRASPAPCLPFTNTRTDTVGTVNMAVTSQTPTPPDFTPPLLPTTVPLARPRRLCFCFEYVDEEIRAPVELLSAHLWQCDTEPWTDSWLEEVHVRFQALLAKTKSSEYPNLFRNDDDEEDLVGRFSEPSRRSVTNGGQNHQPRQRRSTVSTSLTTLPFPAALFWALQIGCGMQPSFGPDRTREAVARAIRLRNAFTQSLTETDLMVATYATADTSWEEEEDDTENNGDESKQNHRSSCFDSRNAASTSSTPTTARLPPTSLKLSFLNGTICLGLHALSSYLWQNSGQGWIENTRQRLHQIPGRPLSSSSTPSSASSSSPSTASAHQQPPMIPPSMRIKIARALHSRTASLDDALIVSLKLGPGTKNASGRENDERYEMAVTRAAKLRDCFRGVMEAVSEREIEEWAEGRDCFEGWKFFAS